MADNGKRCGFAPKPHKRPKPSVRFDMAVAEEFCTRLALGENLKAICRQKGMPSARNVFYWLNANGPDADQFKMLYVQAHAYRTSMMREDCLDIIDSANPETIDKAKARVAARHWDMARAEPKKYGAYQRIANDPVDPFIPAQLGPPTVEITNAEDEPEYRAYRDGQRDDGSPVAARQGAKVSAVAKAKGRARNNRD